MSDTWITMFAVTMLLICIDFISGVSAAAKNGNLSSKKMREGLWHKFAYILVIATAAIIEFATTKMDLGVSMPIFVPVCGAICLIEITSSIENCIKLNPDLSNSRLLEIFEQFERRYDETKNNDKEESGK